MTHGIFDDRAVVVTGVGGGGQVGAAVAKHFFSLGAGLVLVGNDASVRDRAAELGGGPRVEAWQCDLTDPVATNELATRVAERRPAIHGLVCAAGGFAMSGTVDESDPAAWHRQVSINLTTAFVASRAFLPALRAGRGAVVYFAAAAALPEARAAKMSGYVAAKAGVIALMRAVAQEEKSNGVRANALAPTTIRTATNEASLAPGTGWVERETVAEWVALLCAPDGVVNGQVIKLGT